MSYALHSLSQNEKVVIMAAIVLVIVLLSSALALAALKAARQMCSKVLDMVDIDDTSDADVVNAIMAQCYREARMPNHYEITQQVYKSRRLVGVPVKHKGVLGLMDRWGAIFLDLILGQELYRKLNLVRYKHARMSHGYTVRYEWRTVYH